MGENAKRLPKGVFKSLKKTIEVGGQARVCRLADVVATAMKEWAIDRGATHYAHVFQPLTGLTAEKHDQLFDARARRPGGRRVHGLATGARRTR